MAGVLQWMATCSSEGIGKEGRVVRVPYTGETFDSMELQDSDMVECLWVRIREKANMAHIWVRGLFSTLTQKVPWEAAFKNRRAHEGWTYFKKEILMVQEQAAPKCQKMSQWGRPAWVSRDPAQEHRLKKEGLSPLEKEGGNTRSVSGCHLAMQKEI